MKFWMALAAVAAFATISLAVTPSQPERPPVFDARPYVEAKAAAAKDKKWFIVKATAEWCGPCKQMNKTTWRDAKVEAWAKAHAVVVELDVDKEEKIARELGIEAMPTMIAFKEGSTEFDRVVGYKGPAEFLDWLEGIERGEKSIVAVDRRVAAADGKADEVRTRHDRARTLMQQRKYAEAKDEFVWLWEHSKDVPAYAGVRVSFMAGEIENLTERHPPAKERFTKFRDDLTLLLDHPKVEPSDVLDWVVLNSVLGDDDRTLQWFDRVKNDAKWKPVLHRVSHRLERMLLEKKRWADVGNLIPDPIAHLERDHQIFKMMPKTPAPRGIDEEMKRRIEEMPLRKFREDSSQTYAALLAARREDDANRFATRARELDAADAMTLALVRMALEAGQPRSEHAVWLAAIKEPEAASLAEQVERAMKDRAQ